MKTFLKRPTLLFALLIMSLPFLLTGCDDDDSPTDPGNGNGSSDPSQNPLAWVWGYDTDTKILTAYHSRGEKRVTFTTDIHPHLQIHHSPSNHLWMGFSNSAISFTSGFWLHGNHDHMETPKKFISTSGGYCAHMGFSTDGRWVAVANNDSTFYWIDTDNNIVTTVDNGSGHSAALITKDNYIFAYDGAGNWGRIIDAANNTVLGEVTLSDGAHGEAYNKTTDKVFIPVDDGIEVIDIASKTVTKKIDYPNFTADSIRTYIMYHDRTGQVPVAVCPGWDLRKPYPDAQADRVFLLDMTNEMLETITIPGSRLAWKKDGWFDLSKDGKTAVFSDMNAALIYIIDVDPTSATYKKYTSITTPAVGVSVAVGYRGDHIFVLHQNKVYPVDVEAGAIDMDGALTIKDDTDWIYVTSPQYADDVVVDESEDKGDTVQNPEDIVN